MSNENLSKATKDILVQAPLAAASTPVGGSAAVDCANFLGCKFTHVIGTQASTDLITAKIQCSTSSTAWVDCYDSVAASKVTQATTADSDDTLLILDVFRPQTRYLRSHVANTTGTEYGGTIATLYGPRLLPTSGSTTYGTTAGPMQSVSPGTT